MATKKIIKINDDKCNGCGACVPACHEGAIQIINGKAKLFPDKCDGLGACLGHCPQGAITIEEETQPHGHGGCPGSRIINRTKDNGDSPLRGQSPATKGDCSRRELSPSELRQWPVQIRLVPTHAPYFSGADLLVAADCVPFAYPNFHADLLKDKTLLVGCPKLDDLDGYREKLSEIIKDNEIKSVTYAHMEVPCCFGLISVLEDAIAASGKDIPFHDITITLAGEKK